MHNRSQSELQHANEFNPYDLLPESTQDEPLLLPSNSPFLDVNRTGLLPLVPMRYGDVPAGAFMDVGHAGQVDESLGGITQTRAKVPFWRTTKGFLIIEGGILLCLIGVIIGGVLGSKRPKATSSNVVIHPPSAGVSQLPVSLSSSHQQSTASSSSQTPTSSTSSQQQSTVSSQNPTTSSHPQSVVSELVASSSSQDPARPSQQPTSQSQPSDISISQQQPTTPPLSSQQITSLSSLSSQEPDISSQPTLSPIRSSALQPPSTQITSTPPSSIDSIDPLSQTDPESTLPPTSEVTLPPESTPASLTPTSASQPSTASVSSSPPGDTSASATADTVVPTFSHHKSVHKGHTHTHTTTFRMCKWPELC